MSLAIQRLEYRWHFLFILLNVHHAFSIRGSDISFKGVKIGSKGTKKKNTTHGLLASLSSAILRFLYSSVPWLYPLLSSIILLPDFPWFYPLLVHQLLT